MPKQEGENKPSEKALDQMRGPSRMGNNMQPVVRASNTAATLHRLWGYLGRQRLALFIVFIVTILGAAINLVGPFLIGKAIDDYIIPQDYYGLLGLCLILLTVYVGGSLMNLIQAYMMVGVSQRTVWELRNDMFAQLQKLPLRFFDKTTHGELMSRTTNDVENVNNTLAQSFTQMITSVITIIGALFMMLYLNVWLTLVSVITVPILLYMTKTISKYTRKLFTQQQESLGQLNGFIEETISGQKVVKLYRREATASGQFAEINARLKKAGTGAQNLSGMFGPVMNMMGHFGFILIATIGGWMVLKDWTTIGIIISFLSYSRQFSGPINELANQYNMIQSGIAGAERVFEIMDTPSEYAGEVEAEAKPFDNVAGEVVFQDVSFGYEQGVSTLKNVDFIAKPGETIALVGPTGAGKTTIVNLLTRFYDIDQGMITIDGEDIRQLGKDSLRSQLGIVLQDAYLFSDTIRENIRYGRLEATDEEVEEAARLANADGFIRKMAAGYDSSLSAEGGNISHGQRQLITIARAILADPAILILDEATSSIDTRTEMHIHEAMNILMRGRTCFVIAHRLSTIREADTILVIDHGEIIERGTHEQLIEQQGFYYNLYSTQFQRTAHPPGA